MSTISIKRFCRLLVSGYLRNIQKILSNLNDVDNDDDDYDDDYDEESVIKILIPKVLYDLCIAYYPVSLKIHHSGWTTNQHTYAYSNIIVKTEQLRYDTLVHKLDIDIINIWPQFQRTNHYIQTLNGEIYAFNGRELKFRSSGLFESDDVSLMSTVFCCEYNNYSIGHQYIYFVTSIRFK